MSNSSFSFAGSASPAAPASLAADSGDSDAAGHSTVTVSYVTIQQPNGASADETARADAVAGSAAVVSREESIPNEQDPAGGRGALEVACGLGQALANNAHPSPCSSTLPITHDASPSAQIQSQTATSTSSNPAADFGRSTSTDSKIDGLVYTVCRSKGFWFC